MSLIAEHGQVPAFLRDDEGELLTFSGVATTVKVQSAWTTGSFCVVRQVIPPRRLFPPHVHTNEEHVGLVVSGTIGFRVGDDEFQGAPGDMSVRPRGVAHSLWNPTDEPSVLIEITSPGHFEAYMREAASEFSDAAELRSRWGIELFDDWTDELCARHGLHL